MSGSAPDIQKAACVGGGVIGAGWMARLLWHGIDVTVADPHPQAERRCYDVLANARRSMTRLWGRPPGAEGRLRVIDNIAAAVAGADFIQESGPEDIALKQTILDEIDRHAPVDALVCSSTSGLLPTVLQSAMRYPGRFMVGHPFNPVYLLPLVEVCGGDATAAEQIARAQAFYRSLGMYPLHVRREIDGFIADRLLEALWREALWLVNDDVATVTEIDDAIRYGAGLRWAMMGTFMTYRIAGGEGGMKSFMAQFGPALQWPWTKLTDVPALTEALVDKIAAQSDVQAAGADLRELERRRDDGLIAIMQALKPHGIAAGALLAERKEPAAAASSAPGIAGTAAIPDFDTYPVVHAIEAVEPWSSGAAVSWSDGHTSRFHGLWLRDNCPCPVCVDPMTREQLFDISTVPDDMTAGTVSVSDEALAIDWPDGHRSRYHPGWLRAHCYSRTQSLPSIRRTWDSGFSMPAFDAGDVLNDDNALLAWLDALDDSGLTLLRNCPLDEGAVEWFADRIGFLRQTNFGRVFDVRTKAEPDSTAYTAHELPLHSDLPTRELQPGLQFLLCRVNDATGGDSIMADGFRIAEAMRAEEPAHFETLSTLPMEFRNRARSSDYRMRLPAIRLDTEGAISEIRLGNFLRGPQSVAEADMPRLYAAYRHFVAMTREDRFRIRFRLNPGEMAAFDNRRVLHARSAFDPASGDRHLQGCYVDTDELQSRRRILRRARQS